MKRIFIGIVLPLSAWALVIYLRGQWPYDIHPYQPLWITWVISMSLGAFFVGVGFNAFWYERKREQAARLAEQGRVDDNAAAERGRDADHAAREHERDL